MRSIPLREAQFFRETRSRMAASSGSAIRCCRFRRHMPHNCFDSFRAGFEGARVFASLCTLASQNVYLPVAIFPTLVALPKKCEREHRTDRPFGGWKISEPKTQFLLGYRLRLVSPLPIIG